MSDPRIVLDGGVIVLESRTSPVRVSIFAHELHDGGIYFELAAHEGSFRTRGAAPERSRVFIVTHRPEETEKKP